MKPFTLRRDRLETRLAPAVATWDGGGADNHWTTAVNWAGDVAPNPGDDLVFPAGAAQLANDNDFPAGTAFHTIDVKATGYQLTGNAIALAAGLSIESGFNVDPSIAPVIGLPLTLTADQTFSTIATYTVTGSIDLNGHALTFYQGIPTISGPITGTGSLTFYLRGTQAILSGTSTFAGPTTVSVSTLYVNGTLPGPVTVQGSIEGATTLSGTGTVGNVTVLDGGDLFPGSNGSFPVTTGTLKTRNLSAAAARNTNFAVVGPGAATGLDVTGTVQVGGQFNFGAAFGATGPRPGDRFRLINNDGTDPIVGRFANAPDGALLGGPSFSYRLSYHGGDGNDLVATVASGPSFAVGAGAGGVPIVNVYAADGSLVSSFFAYASSFRGGVRVATADVTGDSIPDIITAPGPGAPPEVKVFDGSTMAVDRDFMAYDPRFLGGVFVAASRIRGDSHADIITGAGAGGGPHVKVFAGDSGATFSSFFAYDPRFTGGVSVAGTDSFTVGRSSGLGSVITGAGPGGGPHVRVFNGLTGALSLEFFAYDAAFRGGVNVASRGAFYDLIPGSLLPGAQRATAGAIVTSPVSNGVPDVRVFGPTGQRVGDFGQVGGFLAYDPRFLGGVTVAVRAIDTNGTVTLETGAGPGGGPHVKTWQVANGVATLQQEFFAFDPAFRGGVFVG